MIDCTRQYNKPFVVLQESVQYNNINMHIRLYQHFSVHTHTLAAIIGCNHPLNFSSVKSNSVTFIPLTNFQSIL